MINRTCVSLVPKWNFLCFLFLWRNNNFGHVFLDSILSYFEQVVSRRWRKFWFRKIIGMIHTFCTLSTFNKQHFWTFWISAYPYFVRNKVVQNQNFDALSIEIIPQKLFQRWLKRFMISFVFLNFLFLDAFLWKWNLK